MTATVPALLQPLKDRLAAATPGPWKTVRHDLSLYVESESGELNPINLGYVGNRPERDGDFIAASPTDQAKLISAIEAVVGWCEALDVIEACDPSSPGVPNVSAARVASKLRFALTQALGGDTA
jgi:hypothetical protein